MTHSSLDMDDYCLRSCTDGEQAADKRSLLGREDAHDGPAVENGLGSSLNKRNGQDLRVVIQSWRSVECAREEWICVYNGRLGITTLSIVEHHANGPVDPFLSE